MTHSYIWHLVVTKLPYSNPHPAPLPRALSHSNIHTLIYLKLVICSSWLIHIFSRWSLRSPHTTKPPYTNPHPAPLPMDLLHSNTHALIRMKFNFLASGRHESVTNPFTFSSRTHSHLLSWTHSQFWQVVVTNPPNSADHIPRFFLGSLSFVNTHTNICAVHDS